jgi:hypothetical protein
MKILGIICGITGVTFSLLSDNITSAIWAFNYTLLVIIYVK